MTAAQGTSTSTSTSTTETTEVPRIVGEPLDSWVTVAAGAALLVVIVLAGLLVRARSRR